MNQVIALVGMCGSGKSVCCEQFRLHGWEYVYFGGVTMRELERIVMLRYGITDMRALYEGDVRFLSQFRED